MASRDSNPVMLRDFRKSLMMKSPKYLEDNPSDVVPGGATSPALAFKMYSKGCPLPSNKFYPGQFDEQPLGALTTPKTKEEFFQSAKEAKFVADAPLSKEAERVKAEEDAKAAEIQRKIDFADKYMNNPDGVITQPPA